MSYFHEPRPDHQVFKAFRTVVWVAFWFLLIYCLAPRSRADVLELQRTRWASAKVRPDWTPSIKKSLWNFERDRKRYEAVTAMNPNGVPALVIFALHNRESSCSFRCHLHEGSPLNKPTKYVPKNRPPGPGPFTWEESAKDALYSADRLQDINWKRVDTSLQGVEAYNGTGYQRYHPDVPSPYLWSGTTVYSRGKYSSDGRFDRLATDQQIGCAAILKMAGESAWLKKP